MKKWTSTNPVELITKTKSISKKTRERPVAVFVLWRQTRESIECWAYNNAL